MNHIDWIRAKQLRGCDQNRHRQYYSSTPLRSYCFVCFCFPTAIRRPIHLLQVVCVARVAFALISRLQLLLLAVHGPILLVPCGAAAAAATTRTRTSERSPLVREWSARNKTKRIAAKTMEEPEWCTHYHYLHSSSPLFQVIDDKQHLF